MRIAILSQYYAPEIGAPQTRLFELAKRFMENGHEVHVLTAMPNYPRGKIYPGYSGLLKHEIKKDIRITRTYVYATKSINIFARLVNYFSFVISSLIFGILFLPKMDYLITESPPIFLGVSGYLLSRIKRARWLFNVSDLWPDSALRLGIIKNDWRFKLGRLLESLCYRKAWLVTGQSKEIIEGIKLRDHAVATYLVSNGADTMMFSPRKRTKEIREKLCKNKSCIAVYAGLHGVAQGLEQVLEAACQLKDLNDLAIVFIGDGTEKEYLIKRAAQLKLNNVNFIEPCGHEEMPAILASSDIAIVPLKMTLPGAIPSKLYEAMASGLPVVLVSEGEAAEIVKNANAGMVVSPQDVNSLSLAIRTLAKDPNKRYEMGNNGRLAVIKNFDRREINNRFVKFLEEHIHAGM